MISSKRALFLSALAGSLFGFGLSASAQTAADPTPQAQYPYSAPCMMDGFYSGAPVTSQYPVMMGFYCPYHGMYHFRPVFMPTQQQLQQYQQAPRLQPAPQAAPQQAPDQIPQQNAPAQK